jgi:hypothetical protein
MSGRDHRARIAAGRAVARLGIGAAWGVTMLALVWGAAWLGIWLGDLVGAPEWGVVGLAVWVALAIVICRRSRLWIQRLRRHLMASHVVTDTATVHRVDRYHTYGMMPNRTIYTVWFSWIDAANTPQMRERQYGFYGSGLREFEVRVADGAQIPIRYPAGHPSRFIADIPYTPTMADQII